MKLLTGLFLLGNLFLSQASAQALCELTEGIFLNPAYNTDVREGKVVIRQKSDQVFQVLVDIPCGGDRVLQSEFTVKVIDGNCLHPLTLVKRGINQCSLGSAPKIELRLSKLDTKIRIYTDIRTPKFDGVYVFKQD